MGGGEGIMWKFLVKNQSIEILEREVLADHQIQYVQFKFVFDGDWKRFHKVVQFSQCDETYNIVLGVDGTSLYLPAELHVGAAKMSVFGYDTESDTTVRATTVPVTLNIRPSGFVGDDDPPIPPTPDLYAQLLKKIEEAGKKFRPIIEGLWKIKEQPIVGACTEIPIAYAATGLDPKMHISSLDALADGCVRELYGVELY